MRVREIRLLSDTDLALIRDALRDAVALRQNRTPAPEQVEHHCRILRDLRDLLYRVEQEQLHRERDESGFDGQAWYRR